MEQQVISVKEFVAILNETLSFAYPSVTVEGEVSGFKVNQGKFVFFDLKDGDVTLSCFMMRHQLKVAVEDGMRVRVSGSPKLTNWGKFSFTVRELELAGEGELRRAFELLKGRLAAEGLFDAERKRTLPVFPSRIGLITSATSAAYADFNKILGQRWGGLVVTVADVTVQGQTAEKQIVAAIANFNQTNPQPDVLVLIRGGGSLEDLQAFNTESVARAVAGSRVPIIVGVGHEVDTSLADLSADVRAATPTDAARLVVPDRVAIAQQVRALNQQLSSGVGRLTLALKNSLLCSFELQAGFIAQPRERIARLENTLSSSIVILHQGLSREIAAMTRLMAGFDPAAALARGYSIVRSSSGRVIRDAAQAPAGSRLVIQLAKGKLEATVEHGTIKT